MQPEQIPPLPAPVPPSAGQSFAGQDPATNSLPPVQSGIDPVGTPAIADDNDLIEKEWVGQVKRILATTAHDPYEQSRQFTQLKADYLQKRYGKVIKSEE